MSALPPKADIPQHRLDVRSVPITTECTAANTVTSRGRPTGPTYALWLKTHPLPNTIGAAGS